MKIKRYVSKGRLALFFLAISGFWVHQVFGQASSESRSEVRARANEEGALKNGWEKKLLTVDGIERKFLWKGPASWSKGAILVLHGGSGTASDWCHTTPSGNTAIDTLLKAQVDFSDVAIKAGFAVFSLDSTSDRVTDEKGVPCGKRFDATVVDGRKNVDLPFIGAVIREAIPALRPNGSSASIFMTGESTGGFMTVRASTHFDGLVTAFAPGAACDPYGTTFDASVDTGREARGVGIDRETGKRITEIGAAEAASYPNEKKWETMNPAKKPPFMGIHHADDGIVDLSCHEKLVKQLVAHGYPMESDFVVKSRGKRNVWAHLWQPDYNAPILRFFEKWSAPGTSSMDRRLNLLVGGVKREYLIHLPSGYNDDKKWPLVIFFHGGGGVAKAAIEETGLNEKADRSGFIAVYPEGLPPDPSQPGNFRKNPQTWNDGSGRYHAGEANTDDVGFVRTLIAELKSKFAADPKRIFLVGFSNGSSMVYRLGLELSDLVAAIAPVASSGLRVKNPEMKRAVPMITIQGTADPRNPLEGGDTKLMNKLETVDSRPPVRESVERWAKMIGIAAAPMTNEAGGVKTLQYGPGKDGSEIVFLIVEGMGHTWPSGKSLLPESLVGKLTDKLKANDVIWEFFQKHHL